MSLYDDINAVYHQYMEEANAYAGQYGLDQAPASKHNGEWDAFRHAYASGAMAMEYGETLAKLFGELNEIRGDIKNDQPPAERNMDEWNNAVGRDIGVDSSSKDEIAEKVRDALNNGDLIESLSDPRRYTGRDSPYGDKLNSPMKRVVDLFEQAERIRDGMSLSPIILDLDGDGIETINVEEGVYFDHRGDGFAERTGWAARDDGLLVWDRDGNGRIDDGGELFGDSTRLKNGSLAADGFQVLAEHDDNGDGKIDAADAIWTHLRLWRDEIQDGNAAAAELHTLAEFDIRSISTATTYPGTPDAQGNIQTVLGSFEKTNGATGQIADYHFLVDNTYTIATARVELAPEIAALPGARGYGRLHDLRQAMALDASGALMILVQNFGTETDPAARDLILEQILFKWSGVEGVDPGSRGGRIDARRLGALEAFMGGDFAGTAGSSPAAAAVSSLERAYASLSEFVNAQLLARTHAKPLYDRFDFVWDETTLALKVDFDPLVAEIRTRFAADPEAGKTLLTEFGRMVRGFDMEEALDYGGFRAALEELGNEALWALDTGGKKMMTGTAAADIVTGTSGSDAFQGGEGNDRFLPTSGDDAEFQGNDTLSGGGGDDWLYGQGGNDILDGGAGNDHMEGRFGYDILDGGPGNDVMEGGFGNDIYMFGNGYGVDVVYEQGSETEYLNNVVLMTADVSADRVGLSFSDSGREFIYSMNGGADRLTIDAGAVKETRFADGTIWDVAAMAAKARVVSEDADTLYGVAVAEVIHGLGGGDFIEGNGGGDVLFGDGGDDAIHGWGPGNQLSGGDGNDILVVRYFNNDAGGYSVLDGGAGDDRLSAEGNENAFLFGRGYGHDTIDAFGNRTSNIILLGADISPSDITVSRDAAGFHFDIEGTADRLTVSAAAYGSDMLIPVRFRNGVVWNTADVHRLVLQSAGEGHDYLVGGSGNDVISSLGGNDEIHGRAGDDRLEGGAGNDALRGNEGSDRLDGGAGNDSLDGDAGSDVYSFGRGYGQDIIYDAAYQNGSVNVAGDIDSVQMQSGVSPAEVTVSRGGYQSADLVIRITGTTDKLSVYGWFDQEDNNTLRIVFSDGTVWNTATINSMIPASAATTGTDNLYGTAGADVLNGQAGNDVLKGNAGNDILDGGSGNDELRGGNGDDTYLFGRGYGFDYGYDYGSDGIDTVQFAPDVVPGDVTRIDDDYTSYLELSGGADRFVFGDSDGIRIERAVFADGTIWDLTRRTAEPILGTASGEILNGTRYADEMYGMAGDDSLYGESGDDILIGGDGNDSLVGRSGNDTLDGGPGNDSLRGDDGNDIYVFGRGYDRDTIVGAYGVIEFKADVLPSDLVLTGYGRSDLAVDIAGTSDRLELSYWFKPYDEYDKKNTLFRFADGTQWTAADIDGRVRRSGTAGADDLIASDVGSILNGKEGNDLLSGGNGNDTLLGDTGHDSIYGSHGNDMLEGGTGNDLLAGEEGDDIYVFRRSFGYDTLNESYGEGHNKIVFADNILPSEIIVTADNQRAANANNNIYLGIRGTSDLITISNWLVPEEPTITRVEFANGTVWDTTTLLSKLNLATQVADVIHGSVGNDSFEGLDGNDEIYGLAGDDVLRGGRGDDWLYGGEGNDVLNGSSGNDKLFGGAGNDTYLVDSTSDVVTENAAEGVDLVQSSVTYTLTNGNVENLTLTGTTAINGTGNALDNVLTGNSAANTLDGGAGADQMAGGAGHDTYIVDDAVDIVVENLGEGTDTVYLTGSAFFSYTLGTNVEKLTLSSLSSARFGYGNEFDNTLTGNTQHNYLNGQAGNDTLYGGAGNDTLLGYSGNDTLVGGTGNDTYILGRGHGGETVMENDATAGNTDVAQFLAGIATDQIWFRRLGDDLEVSVIGTPDQLMIDNWYQGNAYHLEQFKTADGKTLLDSRVDNLVNAMASFAPPPAGQTTLPPDYQTQLNPVIAANWQ